MSEPAKKPGHAPESYTPKKPEIVNMVEGAQDVTDMQGAPQAAPLAGGNKILPNIRDINNGCEGKNYGLNDCMAFLMECQGEPELDYHLFGGITGDSLTMVYNRKPTTLCEYCVSGYLAGPEYIGSVFDAIGYAHTYVTAGQINADKAAYLRMVTESIDKGIPVLVKTNLKDVPGVKTDVITHFLFVGYEDGGKTLRLHWYSAEKIVSFDTTGEIPQDWIFVGEKKRDATVADIARSAFGKMSYWLTLPEKDGMFFGPQAFRAWAEDIENGRYDNESDMWGNYGVYACNMASNSCAAPHTLAHFARYTQYADLLDTVTRLYKK